MSLVGFEEASKVFIYVRPTDMRMDFDGPYGLAVNHMALHTIRARMNPLWLEHMAVSINQLGLLCFISPEPLVRKYDGNL